MPLQGTCFVLELGIDDSTLGKLIALDSRRLLPVGALRRRRRLWITLKSPASTQRIVEAIGPGVPVTEETVFPSAEAPPGTDWLVRAVGDLRSVEQSVGRLLGLLKEIAEGIGQTDLVQMRLSGGEPALLDFRIATRMGPMLEARRLELLELAEALDLSMVVQPLSMFKKRKGLACFDLDSTLVSRELIIEVAKRVGKESEVAQITQMAMAGELDYKRSFVQRVALLRGVSEEDLLDVWRGIRPRDEVIYLLDSLRMRGIKTAILSGAFTFFTDRAREQLEMDYSIGNQVEIVDGRMTGNVKGEIVDGKAKVSKMRELAASLNLTLDQVVAVGDGANDVDIVREAGTGIAFNKAGLVKAYADALLSGGRLQDMLFLIG